MPIVINHIIVGVGVVIVIVTAIFIITTIIKYTWLRNLY